MPHHFPHFGAKEKMTFRAKVETTADDEAAKKSSKKWRNFTFYGRHD